MTICNIEVAAIRGNSVESIHRVHLALVDDQGNLQRSAGNANYFTFARSTAKLLQAVPLVSSGAADCYGLTNRELAVICASHNGEPEHVETVRSILRRIGLDESALHCGPHDPHHRPTAERMRTERIPPASIHNTCSGKHAGMLAYARYRSWPLSGYWIIEHPLQQEMLRTVGRLCGQHPSEIRLGIDGCGVPVFGMPLRNLALAFAKIANPTALERQKDRAACERIIAAIREYPQMLAGDDRFDTRLIRTTRGRIIGKMGAEGVFALSITESGLGLALKIEDGSMRALYPAVTECLYRLNFIDGHQLNDLREFHSPVIFNTRGDAVGRLEPRFAR